MTKTKTSASFLALILIMLGTYLLLIPIIVGTQKALAFLDNPTGVEASTAEVNVPDPTPILSVPQQIEAIFRARQVGAEFRENFDCLMSHENNTWSPYAYHVNIDGSVDLGLLQWNSRQSPVTISDECKFDIDCSVNEFINYIQAHPDGWLRWYGWRDNCQ